MDASSGGKAVWRVVFVLLGPIVRELADFEEYLGGPGGSWDTLVITRNRRSQNRERLSGRGVNFVTD